MRVNNKTIMRSFNGNLMELRSTEINGKEYYNFQPINFSSMNEKETISCLQTINKLTRVSFFATEFQLINPSIAKKAIKDIYCFFVIRSPLARAISNWKYDTKNPRFYGKINSFTAWKNLKEKWNQPNMYANSFSESNFFAEADQVKYELAIKAIDKFDDVFVQDKVNLSDEFRKRGLRTEFDLEKNLSHSNLKITDQEIEIFHKENILDEKLYQYCIAKSYNNSKDLIIG